MMEELQIIVPHKIDENLWKNREQIEEILHLFEEGSWPKAVRSRVFVPPILTLNFTATAVEFRQLVTGEASIGFVRKLQLAPLNVFSASVYHTLMLIS